MEAGWIRISLPDTRVTNSCPPACERPRFSNGSRVAHRTDNSVVTFWNNARNQSRVGFQPHHGPVRILPARNGVNRRISIYLSTRAGNLPRDRTLAEVGLDTNRSSGLFHSEITERVLSPDLAGSDSIYRVFKTQLLFRNTRWHFNGERGRHKQGTFKQAHLFNKHVYRQSNECGTARGQDKALQPSVSNYQCTVTYTVLLAGLDATTFIQKERKKRPPHKQGSQTRPVGLYHVGHW